MSKKLRDNYNVRIKQPIDTRMVCNNISDIDRQFEGLLTYQKSDKLFYYVDENGTPKELTNGVQTKINNLGLINVKDYGAKGDGINDDSDIIQNCINMSYTSKKTVYLPPGTYKITKTLTITSDGVQICGSGGNTLQTKIIGIVNGSLLDVTSNYNVKIKDIAFYQSSTSGATNYCVSLKGSEHSLENCSIYNLNGNASPMVMVYGSNTFIQRCEFTNDEPNAFCLNFMANSAEISINNYCIDSYFGGRGEGILVSSSDNTTMVEGLKISRNVFINTGGTQVFVQSALHLDIENNMFDQSSGICIYTQSTGRGIQGLIIDNNYISTAQNKTDGVGIKIMDTTILTVQIKIINNMIIYCGFGMSLGEKVQYALIDGNTISDITGIGVKIYKSISVKLLNNDFNSCAYSWTITDGTTGGKYIIKNNTISGLLQHTITNKNNFIIKDNEGYVSNKFSSATFDATTNAIRYPIIAHGLSGTPDLSKCLLTVAQVNSNSFEAGNAKIIAVDATNITCSVLVVSGTAGAVGQLNAYAEL